MGGQRVAGAACFQLRAPKAAHPSPFLAVGLGRSAFFLMWSAGRPLRLPLQGLRPY
jgi:hypothetical protein